jgi:predicted Zn-dependent protease
MWYLQSSLYAEAGKQQESLACLERAYAHNPTAYQVRCRLANALQAAGRYAEAETHLRWCIARRPADKVLTVALVNVTKKRLAQRQPSKSSFGVRGELVPRSPEPRP